MRSCAASCVRRLSALYAAKFPRIGLFAVAQNDDAGGRGTARGKGKQTEQRRKWEADEHDESPLSANRQLSDRG